MPTSPGALVNILTTTWKRIRADHPNLPDAHLEVMSKPALVLHPQDRWELDEANVLHSVRISTHQVAGGPEEVVTALLHEAAHVLCWTRGMRDTTVRGRYHNEAFLNAASEVGLDWPADQPRDLKRGFADVVMSPEALRRHADDLAELASLPPIPVAPLERARAGRADKISAQCQCTPPRRIWMAQSKLDIGPVICGVCGKAFT